MGLFLWFSGKNREEKKEEELDVDERAGIRYK